MRVFRIILCLLVVLYTLGGIVGIASAETMEPGAIHTVSPIHAVAAAGIAMLFAILLILFRHRMK